MHERVSGAWNEAVVDEEILLDVQRGVAAIEVSCTITGDAMAQREVLRTCRRADRIGLHEAETLDRGLQADRREETAHDRVAAKFGEGDAGCHVVDPERRRARCH